MKKVMRSSRRLFDLIAVRLEENSKKILFGSCSVTVTIHNGKITKCDYSQTELNRFEVEDEGGKR